MADFHPAVLAADTVDWTSGTSSRMMDTITRGLPGAAISGGLSIYNTFLDYTGQQTLDTYETVRRYDQEWGDYYQEHKEGVDLVGFIGTSLVPGTLGVKALRLAQAGEATGAVSRALGLFPSRKMQYLDAALQGLGRSGGSITSEVLAARRAQLAYSVADNVLTSAAAEIAIAATMNESPVLENQDVWSMGQNILLGGALGGVLGGALDHMAARGVLKSARTEIEKVRRDFDTVLDTSLPGKSLGVSTGDENLLMAESIVNLRTADEINLDFKYKYDGKPGETKLDLTPAMQRVRNEAERVALDKLSSKFNVIAGGDEATGQALFGFMRNLVQERKSSGVSTENMLDELHGYLQNLTKASGVQQDYITAFAKADAKTLAESKAQFLDLESRSIGFDISPSVADLKGFAKRDVTRNDVTVAGRTYVQQASTEFELGTTQSLDASARFVWAENLLRRTPQMLRDRVIDAKDFPLMDALVRSEYTRQAVHGLDDFGIKIKLLNGNVVPLDSVADRLPLLINETKLQWLAESLNAAPKGYDTRYLATLLNQPRQWVEDAISSSFAPTRALMESMQDLTTYLQPKFVQLEYDLARPQVSATARAAQISDVGPSFRVTAELSHQYELRMRRQLWDTAFKVALEKDADLFMDLGQDFAKQLSSEGAGATTVGAANANYGDLAGQWAEYTGKQVALISGKNKEATIQAMAPHINAVRQSPPASAELGVLTTALRRDPRRYFLEGVRDESDEITSWRLIDSEVKTMIERDPNIDIEEAIATIEAAGHRGSYLIRNNVVGEFLDTSTRINTTRVNKLTTLWNATGLERKLRGDLVYIPPVDTRRYPYFAIVRAKEQIGNITDHAMITAKDPEQLRALAAEVPDQYEVLFKDDTKRFFEAKGAYEYDLQVNESQVNSLLKRRGKLGDYFPEVTAQNVLEDWVTWHGRQEENIVRSAVQVKYRDMFAQMGFLSDVFQRSSTSMASGFLSKFKSSIADPFGDYAKTALNISKQSEYPLLSSMNEFVDRIGTKIYAELDKAWGQYHNTRDSGAANLQALETANRYAEAHGLGSPYTGVAQFMEANSAYPKNMLKEAVIKINSAIATVGLRLDFANSLVNVLSTPILIGTELASIRQLAKGDAQVNGALNALMQIKVPGKEFSIPSTTRLIATAAQNFFAKEAGHMERYRQIGAVTEVSRLYHEMLDNLAYMPTANAAGFMQRVDKGIEKAAKITGNKFSEEFTRFVSADVMRQLTDPLVAAKRLNAQEQNAFILSFVNRTQGNYLYSQRPIIFQGTTGAAVGLFQTYMFNVLQQLTRHMSDGNTRALVTFAGLQSSLYGFNGLPFFDAINSHIIGTAAGNTGHADAYNRLPAFSKEWGDWMLYGTASALPLFGEKGPALYTRGDLNPRHFSVIPVNPADIPAVQKSLQIVDTVTAFGKNVFKGADLTESMLLALEHQGWSRPLAGMAQAFSGKSTTTKGGLISASNELETMSAMSQIYERAVDFGGVTRVLGAKPMDEALALQAMYRSKAYIAADREKLESLGQRVKTKLYNNEVPNAEELYGFMQQYQASGGRIEQFSSSLQRWMRDANTSVVNQMANKLSAREGRIYQQLMGGTGLEDYTNTDPAAFQ